METKERTAPARNREDIQWEAMRMRERAEMMLVGSSTMKEIS